MTDWADAKARDILLPAHGRYVNVRDAIAAALRDERREALESAAKSFAEDPREQYDGAAVADVLRHLAAATPAQVQSPEIACAEGSARDAPPPAATDRPFDPSAPPRKYAGHGYAITVQDFGPPPEPPKAAQERCACCGRGPDECPLIAGASGTCAGGPGDCACFPPGPPQPGEAKERCPEMMRPERCNYLLPCPMHSPPQPGPRPEETQRETDAAWHRVTTYCYNNCPSTGPHEAGCYDRRADLGLTVSPEGHPPQPGEAKAPIDMVLYCPRCGVQHIDAPEPGTDWTNPPHRSHKCHGCGTIWRPADVSTNGVAVVLTRGSADSWEPSGAYGAAAAATAPPDGALRDLLTKQVPFLRTLRDEIDGEICPDGAHIEWCSDLTRELERIDAALAQPARGEGDLRTLLERAKAELRWHESCTAWDGERSYPVLRDITDALAAPPSGHPQPEARSDGCWHGDKGHPCALARAEKAEARIAELEKERDEARRQRDYWIRARTEASDAHGAYIDKTQALLRECEEALVVAKAYLTHDHAADIDALLARLAATRATPGKDGG